MINLLASVLIGLNPAQAPLPVVSDAGQVPISAITTNTFAVTNYDLIWQSNVFIGGDYGQNWELTAPDGYALAGVVEVDNPNRATVEGNLIQYVDAGRVEAVARFLDGSGNLVAGVVPLDMDGGFGLYSTLQFSNWLGGTLGESVYGEMDSRTNGSLSHWKSGTTNRRSDFWLGDCPSIAAFPYGGRGALISPNAVLWAAHVAPAAGQAFAWETTNGLTVTATIAAGTNIGGDIWVGVLSGSIPDVKPVKLVGTNLFGSAPNIYAKAFPVIGSRANTGKWHPFQAQSCHETNALFFVLPDFTFFPSLRAEITGGDSGSPVVLLSGGDVGLLGEWYLQFSPPNAGRRLSEINAAITNLSGLVGSSTNPATLFTL